jgi:histidyl-tRNA synthetase
MFDCKEQSCQELLRGAPVVLDYLSDDNKAHFEKVKLHLSNISVPFVVDDKLVRGLDYYTRTAWEIKSDKLGSQDSLSGGGRYDRLVEQLGGPPTPGIGFAAGMERIIMAMPENAADDTCPAAGAFIVTSSEQFKAEAVRLAGAIRRLGLPADIDYLGRSLKGQMKQAGRSGMKYAVILAENEMATGHAVIKNLENSKQSEIDLKELFEARTADELGDFFERTERE